MEYHIVWKMTVEAKSIEAAVEVAMANMDEAKMEVTPIESSEV